MGCIYGRFARDMDDDRQLSASQSFARDVSVMRSRIAARKMPVIWLLGDQAAVTAHASNVAERFGFACFDAAKIVKEEAAKLSNRARMLRGKARKGKKVPDSVMVDLMKERMVASGDTRGYLFACFPLNAKQAAVFSREVAPMDCVVLLQQKEIPPTAAAPSGPASTPGGVPEGDTKEMDKGKKDKEKDKDKEEEIVREIVEAAGGKWDLVMEKINANEPPSDVFLKIEAAILDRTAST